jgi:UDP-N-acetylglucosamine--N-acetylmuramyl-(pentapeptide) pyrophosphoryl-undecaprenol N-acetylglucosamine transferase
MTRYLFSGGGTGGHLFPGLAVAEELRDREPQARIVFVGSVRDIERGIVAVHGYEHAVLPVEPSTALRRNPLKFLWTGWNSLRSAAALLDRERPTAVIGLGGFASVPLVWTASRRGIPTVLLEQNIVAGRATRLLSRRASLVCLSFGGTVNDLPRGTNAVLTGNPVRREIAALHEAPRSDGLEHDPTLLILGGSQGAIAVNEAVFIAIERLARPLAGWKIVHQTGRADEQRAMDVYTRLGLRHEVCAFFDNLPALFSRATLVVSRAGATTLAELACAGCPAILIPYPNSVRDHQRLNAMAFRDAGAAIVVEQRHKSSTTADSLARELTDLLHHRDYREQMSRATHSLALPEAARSVVLAIEQITGSSQPTADSPITGLSRRQVETIRQSGES